MLIFDIETYADYFLVAFKDLESGDYTDFEAYPGQDLDLKQLRRVLDSDTLVSFNGKNFDMPLITLALAGVPVVKLKKGADRIINQNLGGWRFYKDFGLEEPGFDHIDLIEVAPGMTSLKIYGGRLHARKLQDLPIAHDASITPDQREVLRLYCHNDLDTTELLYRKLQAHIDLRGRMGAQYGIDLRSKSDAQIAEAVIAHEVQRLRGKPVQRPEVDTGTSVAYTAPAWMEFTRPELRQLLEEIQGSEFVVRDNGSLLEPEALRGRVVVIGAGRYRMGIGGLHSSEERQAVVAGSDEILVDRDVASYYPSIILGQRLAPPQMGKEFIKVYQSLVDRRLNAKAKGDKVTADSLKITINGSFGKLGSKWSKLYAPQLLIQTTVTGQLALLMLIEALETAGIRVVSANTDGVVIHCKRSQRHDMDQVLARWELVTGFATEETRYAAIYSRDVNNYIAVKPDGGVKLKGAYAKAGLAKNPANEICTEAAIAWLTTGRPLRETIRGCTDITKFLTLRQVKGGGVKGEQYLGRAVRWYYATGVEGCITYKVNGYKVPRTEGAKPCMDLPETFPTDVDFAWYEAEADSILHDIAAYEALA